MQPCGRLIGKIAADEAAWHSSCIKFRDSGTRLGRLRDSVERGVRHFFGPLLVPGVFSLARVFAGGRSCGLLPEPFWRANPVRRLC